MGKGLIIFWSYFLLAIGVVLPTLGPHIPKRVGDVERRVVFMGDEGLCGVQVSWMPLENGMPCVQRLALLNKLASLSYSGGNKFGKSVRRHNKIYNH